VNKILLLIKQYIEYIPPPPAPALNPERSRTGDFTAGGHVIIDLEGLVGRLRTFHIYQSHTSHNNITVVHMYKTKK
jgi:hypothetical protein